MRAVHVIPDADWGVANTGSTRMVISALLLCCAVTNRVKSSCPGPMVKAESCVVLCWSENEVF